MILKITSTIRQLLPNMKRVHDIISASETGSCCVDTFFINFFSYLKNLSWTKQQEMVLFIDIRLRRFFYEHFLCNGWQKKEIVHLLMWVGEIWGVFSLHQIINLSPNIHATVSFYTTDITCSHRAETGEQARPDSPGKICAVMEVLSRIKKSNNAQPVRWNLCEGVSMSLHVFLRVSVYMCMCVF